jgi:hypothetical protein
MPDVSFSSGPGPDASISAGSVQGAGTPNQADPSSAAALNAILNAMTTITNSQNLEGQPSGNGQSSGGDSSDASTTSVTGDSAVTVGGIKEDKDGNGGGQGQKGHSGNEPDSPASEHLGKNEVQTSQKVTGYITPDNASVQQGGLKKEIGPNDRGPGGGAGPGGPVTKALSAEESKSSQNSGYFSQLQEGSGGYTEGFMVSTLNTAILGNNVNMSLETGSSAAMYEAAQGQANNTRYAGEEASKQIKGQAMVSFTDALTGLLGTGMGAGLSWYKTSGEKTETENNLKTSTDNINSLNTTKSALEDNQPAGSASNIRLNNQTKNASQDTLTNERNPEPKDPPNTPDQFTTDEKNAAIKDGVVPDDDNGSKFTKIAGGMRQGGYSKDLDDMQKNAQNIAKQQGFDDTTSSPTLPTNDDYSGANGPEKQKGAYAYRNAQSIDDVKNDPSCVPSTGKYTEKEKEDGIRDGYIPEKYGDGSPRLQGGKHVVDVKKTQALHKDLEAAGCTGDQKQMEQNYAKADVERNGLTTLSPASPQGKCVLMEKNDASGRDPNSKNQNPTPPAKYTESDEKELKATGMIKNDPDGTKTRAVLADMRNGGYNDDIADIKTKTNNNLKLNQTSQSQARDRLNNIDSKANNIQSMTSTIINSLGKFAEALIQIHVVAPAKQAEANDNANSQLYGSAAQSSQSAFGIGQSGEQASTSLAQQATQNQVNINNQKA